MKIKVILNLLVTYYLFVGCPRDERVIPMEIKVSLKISQCHVMKI